MNIDQLPAEIVIAANRIRDYIRETPLDFSSYFSELSGAHVYLKLENLQHTGSFKLRGAFNKVLSLSQEQRKAGCVAASSGNHGMAIAYAMKALGVSGVIFVPEHASPAKVEAIKRAGGEVRFFGTDGLDTENHAREYALEHDLTYLSPYNDHQVIAGQGSCGVEVAAQLSQVDAVFVAVGGGGLISGVGSFLKSVNPDVQIVCCQPAASQVMTASVQAGEIIDIPSEPTLSDGTAGGIESGAITFDICRDIVQGYVTVSEEKIAEAMRMFMDSHRMLIEGAAAVAIAGFLDVANDYREKNAVIVICGGNISRETLKKVI
ncbi:MAG: serine/threonine dehydratase [Woeseia sp.]|nr:serine/threonine dehydratase [Woeseia sp.]|tara:strand:+ start:1266 stop:2225 length:960 start_codon:yes stop_codon:yes gene_type:complete